VLGEKFNPYTRQSSEPWVLAKRAQARVRREGSVDSREGDRQGLNVLLLIHPAPGRTPTLEYALDQFVLRGGKLIAFVDPYAYFDQQQRDAGHAAGAVELDAAVLFKAWGVEMDPAR
jgi:ABC-type uncharacterized transport system involved in gliding motility auxiliary subunit